MSPTRATLKVGKDQVEHFDLQQCPHLEYPQGRHVHDLCRCDPDEANGNTRWHIKHVVDGHWPLDPSQDVVICSTCRGAIRKVSTHKAALRYEPLPRKR